MRSFARDFSSSRRAPPMAHRSRSWSSACFSACVFITSVCTVAPWLIGPMPWRHAFGIGVHVQGAGRSLRRAAIAEGDHLAELPTGVDMQQRNRRARRAKALRSRCSSTELSLPIEYSITGLRNSAATSRRMWMLSASRRSRWLR
jgi:hypothetical protein